MKAGKYLWVMMMILLAGITASAQTSTVRVIGSVVERGSGSSIEQATIRLLNIKDSTMVRGQASNRKGNFTFKNVKPGDYLIHVTYIGYEPVYQPLRITGRTNPVDVGKLEMAETAVELGETVVVAQVAEVSVRNDTIEYNADSYKVAEGSILEDLLKKMPGVEVDTEGKVTVNGKEIQKVMVDGKEFFSDDPKIATKNLPAKMIDKVQVYDKKSEMAEMTGFDDGEEETVINLTVKPGMKRGWFGNLYGGYGSEDRYEANAMINRFLNNDQMTLMGGANNTNNMGFSDLASSMFEDMGGGGRPGGGGGGGGAGSGITSSGNAGFNFSKDFSSAFTLGGNTRYSHSDNDAQSKQDQENILTGDSSSYDLSEATSRTKSDNFGVDFRMEWKPDTLTRMIFRPSFRLSHSVNNNYSDATNLDNVMDTVNTTTTRNYSNSDGYDLSANLDFSRKLNSRGRIFSFSLSGGYGDTRSDGTNQSIVNYYKQTDDNSVIDQMTDYENKKFNYRIYLSWVEPLGHNNFIQLSYSISHQRQESLKYAYTQDDEGVYNVLDTAYSQSYRNNFITQRASLSFKSQREKFNYTVGLSLDPSYTKSETFVGDTTLSELSRSVVNLSPMVQFNYLFNRQTNLRLVYNGRTSQPSVTQLQPIEDVSDPTNITVGNPDLKPKYTNSLSIRFQQFSPEKQRAFMVSAEGSYVVNDIVSYASYDATTGVTTTSYKNVSGNYNASLRMMMNTPLKNRKFSFNTMTSASFSNSNGYINTEKNTNKNLTLSERAGLDFRSTYLDIGMNANFNYSGASNSLQAENDQHTYNYGVGGHTSIYLPLNIRIESDINWSSNSGYSDGYEQNEVLWNASASMSFLKGNQATVRFKIYDILKQQSNISRSVTASYIQDSQYNTLGSYFMVHLIYRFSIFKGSSKGNDRRPHMDRPEGEPPEGEGPRGEGPGGGDRPMGPPPGGGRF